MSTSFPVASEDISAFIRAKYLDRAKDVLVINLIKWLIKSIFGADRDRFTGKEKLIALTLKEIASAKTTIYDHEVPPFVANRFDVVPDEALLNICVLLNADTRIWGWISDPARIRVKTLVEMSSVADMKASRAFCALAIPELADILMARFDAFDEKTQISIISENPRYEFVSRAIETYSGAGGWRHAEILGRALIVPLAPLFSADDIRRVLDAVIGNEQILGASGTRNILDAVFDLSMPVLLEARPHWQKFVEATAHHSYPGIRAKLERA